MKNKKTIFYFVFDGLADWEASQALAGIKKSGQFQIKTIALEKTPKQTMAGVEILPDLDFMPEVDLKDIDAHNTAMLILPGGTAWQDGTNVGIADLVLHCIQNHIPVAAIGEATAFLADLKVFDLEVSTDNLEYMEIAALCCTPSRYGNKLYPKDQYIIIADGTEAVEFAKDIFTVLEIQNSEQVAWWFQYLEQTFL